MEILHLSHVSVAEAAQKAAKVLAAGSLIIYPTDTVYGMGVDALNESAIQSQRTFKSRESNRPFLIILPDVASIEKYAVLNAAARELAERFLPGPLSLVLPAKPSIPDSLTFQGTIGIRIPNDSFCLELARVFGKPYTTTSANRTGRETPATIHDIMKQFGSDIHSIALAVDAGDRSAHVPSTIVSCVDETPRILRQGALSRQVLGLS